MRAMALQFVATPFEVSLSSLTDRPDVTALSGGRFAGTWDVSSAIHARVFGVNGSAPGPEFRVDTDNADSVSPSVASLANGNLLFSWSNRDFLQSASRVFTTSAVPASDERTFSTSFAAQPAVVALPSDGAEVGFFGEDGKVHTVVITSGGVVATGFTSLGPQNSGGDFQNDITGTLLNDGRVFFAWHDSVDDAADVRYEVVSSANAPVVGGTVNSVTVGQQSQPSAAALPDGRVVVVYSTNYEAHASGGAGDIKARIYNPSTNAFGTETTLVGLSGFSDPSYEARVAATSSGIVVAVTADDLVKAQLFDFNLNPVGSALTLNPVPLGEVFQQNQPDVTALTNGNFAVVWEDSGNGAHAGHVMAAILSATSSPTTNHAPTATGASVVKAAAESTSIAALFSWSDPDLDPLTLVVKDLTFGGGYLTKNGTPQAEATSFSIPGSEVNQWSFVAGPAGSGSTVSLQAFDPAGASSPLVTTTVNVNTPLMQSEITVLGIGSTLIGDDDASPSSVDGTDFGSVMQGDTAPQHTFAVKNDGTANLNLGTLSLPAGFSLVEGLSATISPGSLDTFTIRLNTGVVGRWSGQVSFSTNDSNENPFNFSVAGSVSVSPLPDIAISDLGTAATAVATGEAFDIDFVTANVGAATAIPHFAGVYLSTDPVITTADTLLATTSIPSLLPGYQSHLFQKVAIPKTLIPGTYWLGVIGDVYGAVTEIYEDNASQPILLSIVSPESRHWTVSPSSQIVSEGGAAIFTISRPFDDTATEATFYYSTTMTHGSTNDQTSPDYEPHLNTKLLFPMETLSVDVIVPTYADQVVEGDEQFGFIIQSEGQLSPDPNAVRPTLAPEVTFTIRNTTPRTIADIGSHGVAWPISGVGDFNADGHSDVLWRSPSMGQVDQWQMKNGGWSRSIDLGATKPANWQLAGTGDFDGDGTSDVLWRDISNSKVDQWHMKNGNWGGSIDLGATKGADWTLVGVGDFNADGVSDVLWRKIDTSQVDQWQMKNGNWSKSIDLGATKGADWTLAGVGDFNGDGTTDVLWRNVNTSQVDQWQMKNGNWSKSIDLGATKGADWQAAGIGDFNGDGTADVLWFNKSTGREEYWAMKNGNWAGSVDLGAQSTSWQPAGIGDFNNDGRDDALFLDPTTGHVHEQLWMF
jgi:hypothetical protein